jgi:hypothetical protein
MTGNPLNVFRFVFVKGLGHQYPNGTAEKDWAWLKNFRLP